MKKKGAIFLLKKVYVTLLLVLALCILVTGCSAPKTCSHNFSDWETIRETSCANAGYERRTCADCGEVENREIAALPHTEEIIQKGFEPTCINPGQEDETKCTVCGKQVKQHKNIPALGHDLKITTVVNPDLATTSLEQHYCKRCGYTSKQTGEVLPAEKAGLPILYINGDIEGISKYKTKAVEMKYVDGSKSFESYAEIKVQGSSSAAYKKKNFSVKLYEDAAHTDKNKLDLGWGKEFKYCLKANYVDFSHARNIVSCNIFADITATRKNLDANIKKLPTYGTVDGYPIIVYLNNNFHGLYTMNIPKDKWLYGMKDDESKRQAVICADSWSDYTDLFLPMNEKMDTWAIEHCSTSNTAWVRTSFNNMINFVNEKDGAAFRNGIGKYIDVNATIDTMLYTILLNGIDNTGKNITYATYDGTKWIPMMYDLDATWGLWWEGNKLVDQGMLLPKFDKNGYAGNHHYNLLWDKMFKNFAPEIKARYNELRKKIFTTEYIMAEFNKFNNSVPEIVRESEISRWSPPSYEMDYMMQIESYAYNQIRLMDAAIAKL